MKHMIVAGMVVWGMLTSGVSAQGTALVAPAATEAKGEVKAAPMTAGELLTRLETADADLRSLDADILYQRTFGLVGDTQTRQGHLYYADDKMKGENGKAVPGSRRFAIHFKTLKLGEEAARPQDKILVFDGEWLIEKMPEDKQVIKRHVARAGQGFDPLKVGEGPFPLPVGQKRADILAKFDAVLLGAEQDLGGDTEAEKKTLAVQVAGCYQLQLKPKPGDKTEFTDIRLWYRPDEKGNLLPRMARTVNAQEDVSLVRLINVKVNGTLPAAVMDAAVPEGWKQDVQELAGENRR